MTTFKEYITILTIFLAITIPLAILDMQLGNIFFGDITNPENALVGIVLSLITIGVILIIYFEIPQQMKQADYDLQRRIAFEKDLKSIK